MQAQKTFSNANGPQRSVKVWQDQIRGRSGEAGFASGKN